MIRKYHNHTLQTNPRQHEEESQNNYSNKIPLDNKCKATGSLFYFKMIAKLERTQGNAPRQVPMAYADDGKRAIEDLKAKGVIRESTSPWASPIVLVKKKVGGL